jgi:hypothetical protein
MIAAARAKLAADLAATLAMPVHTTMPERPFAPLCYLTEQDDFIVPDDGGPYGVWLAQFRASVIIAPALNKDMIRAADAAAADLLALNDAHDVTVKGYQTDTYAGTAYLIVPALISTRLNP